MKKTLFLLSFLVLSLSLTAQDIQTVRIPSGYQGFLEQGTIYRLRDDGNATTGVSTTHGFYFDGNTYVGIGLGIEGGDGFFSLPVYTAVKYNFAYTKTATPTIQIRLGSYLSEDPGAYADLAVGIRFGSKRSFAVNIMLAASYYEPIKHSYKTYNYDTHVYETGIIRCHPSGLGLRVGIEW